MSLLKPCGGRETTDLVMPFDGSPSFRDYYLHITQRIRSNWTFLAPTQSCVSHLLFSLGLVLVGPAVCVHYKLRSPRIRLLSAIVRQALLHVGIRAKVSGRKHNLCDRKQTDNVSRAWRGGRAANIPRPAVPRIPVANSSTNSGTTTPKSKPDDSKTNSTSKPANQEKQPQTQVPAANIWDQRKAAAQQPRPAATTPQPQRETKVPANQDKKSGQATSSSGATGGEEAHIAVNSFNNAQVRSLLGRGTFNIFISRPICSSRTDSTQFKPHKLEGPDSSKQSHAKGTFSYSSPVIID